jgi:hypothetical protein
MICKICSLICVVRLFIVELIPPCVHSVSLFYSNVYILLDIHTVTTALKNDKCKNVNIFSFFFILNPKKGCHCAHGTK